VGVYGKPTTVWSLAGSIAPDERERERERERDALSFGGRAFRVFIRIYRLIQLRIFISRAFPRVRAINGD